jgi:hypothetical protein
VGGCHQKDRDRSDVIANSPLRALLRVIYGAVFLRLVPDLAAIGFRGRDETPTLAECYVLMGRANSIQ